MESARRRGERQHSVDRRRDNIFRSLFENNPHPMWIYDVATLEILAVNDSAVEHYGYTRDEFLKLSIKNIHPADEAPRLLETVSHNKEEKSRSGIWRHVKKDGSIIDVEVSSHSIRIGTRDARFVLVNDISSRRRAEEALLRSEEKYRDLFENANDAIFIVDADLRYRDANKKAVDLLGYSREELLSMRITDMIPQEQMGRSSREFEKLRSRGGYEQFAGKVRTRDGRWLDVEVSSSAIVVDGRIAGSRDILRDVTDRKRMEDELLRAQKLESIGILAGGIAHDFNNLLMAILGNITLARLDVPPGEAGNRLREAEHAVSRAQDLTMQLLTFSKGGAPVKNTIALRDVIRDTVSFSLRGSKSRGDCDIPEDLWSVDADRGQLSQVFNNLAINADQAMPSGGTLRIRCENRTLQQDEIPPLAPGRYVHVSFADRGIGIPREHIEKVFDPYFTTKQKGSGLGLATSYSIVKKHGGYFSVESELGRGAVFHVYLPAAAVSAQNELRVEQPVCRSSGGRILVVDDEEMIREVVQRILEKQGYETICVPDGIAAISRYEEAQRSGTPFNAVIMDLTIPGGMGGQETVKHLRAIDPQAKVIVSSGYSNDPVMAQYRQFGFDGVVTKPYTIAALGSVVRSVLDC